jgi:serine/threonine protein kinase
MVYLVDFGLARTYKRSNVHLECQEGRQLAGTARYVSLATHRGLSQSRRDDLECLALVLIYLSRGNLPWEGIRHQDKATKHQRIYQSKLAHTPDVLCEGLKPCFAKFLLYARSLKYDETPDYDYCRRIFRDELDKSYGDGADSWIDDGEVSSNYGGLTFCWNDWNTGGTSDEEDEETIRIESLRSSQIAQSSQNATTQETGKQASPPGYNASFSE